jgi:hypothetical protein
MTEKEDQIEIAIVQLVSGEQIATCIERYDAETGEKFDGGVFLYRPLIFQMVNRGDGMKLFVNKLNHFTDSYYTFVSFEHIVTLDPLSEEFIEIYFDTWEEYDNSSEQDNSTEFLAESSSNNLH